LLGIVFWFIDRQKISKNVFRVFLFGFTSTCLPLASILTFEILGDYNNQLIYNDTKYRLEESGRSIMNPCTLPTLFVKSDFYEQNFNFLKEDYCIVKSQIKKVEIEPVSSSMISVTFFLSNDIFTNTPNPLKVIYCNR